VTFTGRCFIEEIPRYIKIMKAAGVPREKILELAKATREFAKNLP